MISVGGGLATGVKLAVAAELAVMEKDGHGLVVPEHAALPDTPDQPLNAYPALGTAIQNPTMAPLEYVPDAQLVPVTLPLVAVTVQVKVVPPAIRGWG